MDHPVQYRNKAQVPVRRVNGQVETGFFLGTLMIWCRSKTSISKIQSLTKWSWHFEIWFVGLTSSLMMKRNSLAWFVIWWSAEVTIQEKSWSFWWPLVPKVFRVDQLIEQLIKAISSHQIRYAKYQRSEYQCHFGKNGVRYYGQDYITDQMLGNSFQISGPAFIRSIPKWQRSFIRQLSTLRS